MNNLECACRKYSCKMDGEQKIRYEKINGRYVFRYDFVNEDIENCEIKKREVNLDSKGLHNE